MAFSTKFLLGMGIISGLSIYKSYGKVNKKSRDLNKNHDKKNDEWSYDYIIIVRGDEVEVFDPKKNTWVKSKYKKRLNNNSRKREYLFEELEIDTTTKIDDSSSLPTNPFELVEMLRRQNSLNDATDPSDAIDDALKSFNSLEEEEEKIKNKKELEEVKRN